MNNCWSSYLCNLTQKWAHEVYLIPLNGLYRKRVDYRPKYNHMPFFFVYTGKWIFYFPLFFLSGVVWYEYNHPRLFIFMFTLLIISYGFTLSLSKHGFQNYFYRWLLFDVWFPTTPLFSTNKSKWLFNCWHSHATCRSSTDLGNRTHFCISTLRKVRQKEVTWRANDIFLR